MPLSVGYKQNFDTIRRAFAAGDVALMECRLRATGEAVAVVCAANRHEDGSVEFVPMAMMFQDNPYEMLDPPAPDGRFQTQEDTNDP